MGKVQLPGNRNKGFQQRHPKDGYGFSCASNEGRLMVYFQAHTDRAYTTSELMAACQILTKQSLLRAISALREVIEEDPRHPVYLIRVGKDEGCMLHGSPPINCER